jgi:hypothetical protein
VVETDMLKLQEFFEGFHDADMRSGEYARLMDGKKKANENTKTRASSRCDQTRRSNQCDRQEKDQHGHRTYERRHKMIAHTIAIPHDKTEGTATAIETINLIVMMTEGTRRLLDPLRTAKVAIMLTIWKPVSPLLVNVPVPAARNRPSGKSRKFVSNHPHTIDPEVAPQVNRRRTTTFGQGTPPRRLHRMPVDGAGNPPLR